MKIFLCLAFGFFCQVYALPLKVKYLYQAHIGPIPENAVELMKQYSWWSRCPVPISQLAYVQLSYWGFDKKSHQGVLIVNRKVAQDVVDIFGELFRHYFRIDSMSPRYSYAHNVFLQLLSDTTAAFMCRQMVGNSNKFSLHSYGVAIDINPIENPYVRGKSVIPIFGMMYLNRRYKMMGMITKNDFVVKAFKKHGWTWGGDWRTRKDYMHFQKR